MSVPVSESPLNSCHQALGARMIPFAGWNLPVEYSGLLSEHKATRQAAGLFDISHMGQIRATGPGALAALEVLLANDPAKLKDGEGHYTFLLNDHGGVIDDLFLYRLRPDDFLLVVNASRHAEDLALLSKQKSNVSFVGSPGSTAGMALQGPRAPAILSKLIQGDLSNPSIPQRNHISNYTIAGHLVLVGATGYTGEEGYEFFMERKAGPKIWGHILATGKSEGLLPCGLGARDSLRLEAGFPLNGQDLSPEITPVEAGLGFFVDLTRPRPFLGRTTVEAQKQSGAPRVCIGIQGAAGHPPPRHDYPVFRGDQRIGVITSGVPSPTLGHGIALALITAPAPPCGQDLEFEVRGRRVPAKVCHRKFLAKR